MTPFPNPVRYEFLPLRGMWRASRNGSTAIGLTRTEAFLALTLKEPSMPEPLDEEQTIRELDALVPLAKADPEMAHAKADELLIRFLESHGFAALAAAWLSVTPKWYS